MSSGNKTQLWNQLLSKSHKIGDKLGQPIDEGIRETVVAFWANSFKTGASCEGHLNWGEAGPWVDIEPHKSLINAFKKADEVLEKAEEERKNGSSLTEVTPIYDKYHELLEKARKPVLKEAKKLTDLLEEFYQDKKHEYGTTLILLSLGSSVRIQSQGLLLQNINNSKLKKQKLKEYQKEMEAFTIFLKNKFFQ